MNNKKTQTVKIFNAALDETESKEIILRGVVDNASLPLLQFAEYQREILPGSKIDELVGAFRVGKVPDIELGMRGGNFTVRENVFYLEDPIFVIDGKQRVTAAIKFLSLDQEENKPRLGVVVHFNTSEEWERERFQILNAERTKVSPNVLLRNLRHKVPFMEMLYRLTSDSNFVMSGKVCWSQRMNRDHLISSLTLVKTVGPIHSYFGNARPDILVKSLNRVMEKLGRNIMRDNIKTFFNIIEQCWGVRTVVYRDKTSWLKNSFLRGIALLFARHEVFWDNRRLVVATDWVRKIKSFPVNDPAVFHKAGAGGVAAEEIYEMLVSHVDSGRRTNRLRPQKNHQVGIDIVVDDENEKNGNGTN